MEILILVCALGVAAPDCQHDTAIHVFYAPVPEPHHAGCLREGLLHAAGSDLVAPGTYPKVVCIAQAEAAIPGAAEVSVSDSRPTEPAAAPSSGVRQAGERESPAEEGFVRPGPRPQPWPHDPADP
jgi:hypothetical protein